MHALVSNSLRAKSLSQQLANLGFLKQAGAKYTWEHADEPGPEPARGGNSGLNGLDSTGSAPKGGEAATVLYRQLRMIRQLSGRVFVSPDQIHVSGSEPHCIKDFCCQNLK